MNIKENDLVIGRGEFLHFLLTKMLVACRLYSESMSSSLNEAWDFHFETQSLLF